MQPTDSRAGLGLRQRSAARLADVLAGGDFNPFTAAEIADSRDRALANRLVTTALRHHGHINAAMARLLDRGPPKRSGSFEAHLAVEAVKRDTKARHFAPLMNAALRRAQTEAAALRALPVEMLLPRPLQQAWAKDYGADAVANAAANLVAGAPLDLVLRDDDPELIAALGARRLMADSVRIDARDKPVSGLPGYAEGRWWVQDLAAAIPARLMLLPRGASVLDLCAAPGGKTAQLIKAGYRVTALDNNAARLVRLRENLDRLGYRAAIVEADGASYRPERGFDGVLLDAPCSATGTFRRHPEVLWHRGAARIQSRIELQRVLLANAIACLNPGGVLIYCVCSLERGEGEDQLGWIAEAHPELRADPIDPAELPELAGVVNGAGAVRTHPGLAVPGDKPGALDGFFIARFRRH